MEDVVRIQGLVETVHGSIEALWLASPMLRSRAGSAPGQGVPGGGVKSQSSKSEEDLVELLLGPGQQPQVVVSYPREYVEELVETLLIKDKDRA